MNLTPPPQAPRTNFEFARPGHSERLEDVARDLIRRRCGDSHQRDRGVQGLCVITGLGIIRRELHRRASFETETLVNYHRVGCVYV